MKKIFFLFFIALSSCYTYAQTTATNFNVNDCSGTNHDLFTELNSGQVIVMAFVMPCAACIGPSLSAYTEVQNYATTYPGRVKFYLVDDAANTSCATLTSWGNTNGISGIPVFSNIAVNMLDYGAAAMPKIVVVAGSNHEILFIENNGLDVANFNNAIVQGLITGLNETSKNYFKMSIYPDPVKGNNATLKYNLSKRTDLNIDIYNTSGTIVKNAFLEKQAAGKNETVIDLTNLKNGVYFIKLSIDNKSQIQKFSLMH
jgi:hypothetical protein